MAVTLEKCATKHTMKSKDLKNSQHNCNQMKLIQSIKHTLRTFDDQIERGKGSDSQSKYSFCENQVQSFITQSYFTFGDYLIFDQDFQFKIANNEAQIIFKLIARGNPISKSVKQEVEGDCVLGKVVIPFSSLIGGGNGGKMRRVLSLVSQSGIKRLNTHHIRGPSVFYHYQMDFNNNNIINSDKIDNFPQKVKMAYLIKNIDRSLTNLRSNSKQKQQLNLINQQRAELIQREKQKLIEGLINQSPGQIIIEFKIELSLEETHLKALHKVMDVLAVEKPRCQKIFGAIIRIQRWFRRNRKMSNSFWNNVGVRDDFNLTDGGNLSFNQSSFFLNNSQEIDNTNINRKQQQQQQGGLMQTRQFLSTYSKNSTFSRLMDTMNSLIVK